MNRNYRMRFAILCFASFSWVAGLAQTHDPHRTGPRVYAGFDKNGYPGDDLLTALRRSFAFTSYWLNTPPGAASNEWLSKRSLIREHGFGFVILYNGRLSADLINEDAAALGREDAAAAVTAARREGFPARAILFLDQEEGGHLSAEQAAYLFTWTDTVDASAYRAGVYCSGIAVASGPGSTTTTAGEILDHYLHATPAPLHGDRGPRKTAPGFQRKGPALWVANDQCPPAPGCVVLSPLPAPSASGIQSAAVWQYAQSPRRPDYAAGCATTYPAGNHCYAPQSPQTAVDLNTANSPDPSHGR